MAARDFDVAIGASHNALGAMARGDNRPTMALWSRRDDAVLANPLGPPVVGWANIDRESARVAGMFAGEADPLAFEEVVRVATPDLGYLVGFERSRVKRAGDGEIVPMALRVTTIFRREEDGWKLVLRFADRNGVDGKRPDRSNVTNLFSPHESGADDVIPAPDFDTAVAANRQAQRLGVQGATATAADRRRAFNVWSRRDEVTLANPLGPPIVGYANIAVEGSAVLGSFAGGTVEFEEVTRVATPELDFILDIERIQARRAGSDVITPLNLRVATILRREEGGWKRVLRHADRMPM